MRRERDAVAAVVVPVGKQFPVFGKVPGCHQVHFVPVVVAVRVPSLKDGVKIPLCPGERIIGRQAQRTVFPCGLYFHAVRTAGTFGEGFLPLRDGRDERVAAVVHQDVVHGLVPAFQIELEVVEESGVDSAGDLVAHHGAGAGSGRHPGIGRQVHVHGRHQMRELAHPRIGQFGRYVVVDEPFHGQARFQRRPGFPGRGEKGQPEAGIERQVVAEEDLVFRVKGRLERTVTLGFAVFILLDGGAALDGRGRERPAGMVPVILGRQAVTHMVVIVRIPVPVGSKADFPHVGDVFVIHGSDGLNVFTEIPDSEVVTGVRRTLRVVDGRFLLEFF